MPGDVDVRHEDGSDEAPAEDLSLGDLVGRITGDITQLFRQELELAKTEIKEEVAHAGKGAGMMSGAGIAALFGLQMLSLAAAWAVDLALFRWTAFLVVGAVWIAVALVLFSKGKRQLSDAKPFPPPKTVETLKEDAQWVKDQMK